MCLFALDTVCDFDNGFSYKIIVGTLDAFVVYTRLTARIPLTFIPVDAVPSVVYVLFDLKSTYF